MTPFIVIVILFALAWFFIILPQRRRTRSHEAMQDALAVGDEIITAGGLHGFVRELGDDQLKVEIADGVVATLDRRAVAAVAREEEIEIEPEHESEPEEGPSAR